MPHCTRCGAPLNIDAASRLEWKDSLRDDRPATAYLRADEFGETSAAPEPRDALAKEMQDLKQRKRKGAEFQQRLRESTSREGPQGIVVTEESESIHADASSTKRLVINRISEDSVQARRESETRRRVRYMDGNGAFVETRTYDSVRPLPREEDDLPRPGKLRRYDPRVRHHSPALIVLLALLGVAALVVVFTVAVPALSGKNSRAENPEGVIVSGSIVDDLAAHTILIPGRPQSTIYIRELHASYVVAEDGYATVEVPDHLWYDNLEGSLNETMDVTLTPFLKSSSGRQEPMAPISYTITIPLSRIELETPETTRTTISTTMATIKIIVRPGSRVTVNGKDYSDTVNTETGEMSCNVPVQPIGDNAFTIVVRSQYCRDNTLTVVFYRAVQEITLDLDVNIYGTTDSNHMLVKATTLPGAYIEVTTPHADLNITELDSTGQFSFNAVFDHIGNNTIKIIASYPGKKPSEVEHTVYYLPPPDEYTTKAWPLKPEGYSELLSNMSVRAARQQVYEVKGVIQYFITEKPQVAVIYSSDDGKSQPVVVENFTKTKWEVGKYYRLFADASEIYNGMPYLNARYTYKK